MSASFQKLISKFDYHYPQDLIAQAPAKPRDAARLLVWQKSGNKTAFDTFANLGRYLPKNAVLVFNQTRVIPARLTVTKPTGGKVELLYIGTEQSFIKVLANRKILPGSMLCLFDGRQKDKAIKFTTVKKSGQAYLLKPSFAISRLPDILQEYGQTPLPPYIKYCQLTEKQKQKEYQAIFAKTGLSVAAPTASLHFTKKLIDSIKKQGIDVAFVRLDVNLGTFAPLREEQVKAGRLHRESYYIDKKTALLLNQAKQQGRPIIAVGTTVARTLESAARNHKLTKLCGQTDLFIKEDYQFKFVDGMITNFHVPKSSLLMMISALVGRKKLLALYQQAIKKRFRFFSFGDGMLILP